MESHIEEHDRGLGFDLVVLNRRRALTLLGGAGLIALVGCGSGGDDKESSSTTTTGSDSGVTTGADSSGECATIPEETAGPYPGDGTNGPNALAEDGIVRSDITSSFGSASGVAEGIPLTVDLTVVDSGSGCDALAGGAVYLWHCDREGNYSMYSRGVTEENYLRGLQEVDGDGKVTFASIYPGAYSGRWPHIHFEVYASLDEATGGGDPIATSQLAFPEDACTEAYATEGYEDSVGNLAATSLERDNVFSDGTGQQMATVEGSAEDGYTANLSFAV
jgi:protocatechuate 3,4-dioxygenase beta subunit